MKNELQLLLNSYYNLENDLQLKAFLGDECKKIRVPDSNTMISYNLLKRIGVGISKIGASEAIAIGAYVFAFNQLDK